MGHKGLRFLLAGFLGILTIFACPNFVSAQTSSAISIKVSPVRTELEISPGTIKYDFIEITNNSTNPTDVQLTAEEFNVINQKYDYIFTDDSDVVKWIGFEVSTFKLEANETKKIKYSVGVPNNTEPGGRYISLFASSRIKNDGGFASKQRVASLIYVTIIGDVTKTGALVNFNSPWLTGRDGGWSTTIRSNGSTHFHSLQSVTIFNLFGNKVAESSNDSLILPASIKLTTNTLPNLSLPGVYRAIYKVSLGDSPSVEKKTILIYLPSWVGYVFILIIVILLMKNITKKPKS